MTKDPTPSSNPDTEDYIATTIPVRVTVDIEHAVLDLSEAEALLRNASRIALGPCTCRASEGKCDAPIDTCLNLDETADVSVKNTEGFRYVDVETALATLRATHEAGLVHLAFRKPSTGITEFCSCCSCCCWFLTKLDRIADPEALVPSSFIAQHRPDRCIACGRCVSRCAFGAWEQTNVDGEKPTLNAQRCLGCGACVSACPAEAIAFVPRESSD